LLLWHGLTLLCEHGHSDAAAVAQWIVTVTGSEAIPFATITRLLSPAGVVFGTVNSVDEALPGAIDTELQLLVRA
jgi:hypothetical protein